MKITYAPNQQYGGKYNPLKMTIFSSNAIVVEFNIVKNLIKKNLISIICIFTILKISREKKLVGIFIKLVGRKMIN